MNSKAMNKLSLISLFLLISLCVACQSKGPDPDRQWSSYRGYQSSGVLDGADLPDLWEAGADTGFLWKIDIPGLSLSSPVIWGDKVFITTAVSEKDTSGLRTFMSGGVEPVEDDSYHEWKVYCIDSSTGNIIWEDTPCTGIPQVRRHPMSTHANTSMATDGDYAVAFFGSEGLYCYNMEGKLLWEKDFGLLKSAFFIAAAAEWEFASSPIIHRGVVLVQVDVLEDSFIAAFDAETGDELWKKSRDEYPGWCTPNIYSYAGRDIVAVNGYKHRGGYDFLTGEEVWKMSGGGDIPIPTPVVGEDLVYFNSAHGRFSPVIAVKKSASGDITLEEGESSNEGVQWYHPRGGSYIQSLLLYGDYIYNLNLNGQVHCYNALTGEEIYREKIGKAEFFLASPVASDGKIFISSVPGIVYVVQAGPEFRILGEFALGDVCMTTPAITDGMMIIRTENSLVALGRR